jgi:hypothetical protein
MRPKYEDSKNNINPSFGVILLPEQVPPEANK